MDCRTIEPLLSPYLDGELLPAEAAEVKDHLTGCAQCGQEYLLLQQIAGSLQHAAATEVPAPAEFTAALMDRLKNEEKFVNLPTRGKWLHNHWRQTAAGVAAAIMVALGTLSLSSGPVMQVAENPPAAVQPNDFITPAVDSVDLNSDSNTGINSNSTISTAGTNSDTTMIAQNPAGDFEPLVLLNKERTLTTTLLQIKATNSSQALDRAINMSARDSAQIQNMGQQFNEKGSYTVLQITVVKTLAYDLIQGLAALGTVTYQETSKNDINSQFAGKLSQYQALIAQRASIKDSGQLASLDQRIKALESELKDWDQKAEQETVILWLEK